MRLAPTINVTLEPSELARIRLAARRRRCSVRLYIRQAAVALSGEDLAPPRFESDPYARRSVDSFPIVKP